MVNVPLLGKGLDLRTLLASLGHPPATGETLLPLSLLVWSGGISGPFPLAPHGKAGLLQQEWTEQTCGEEAEAL